MGLTTGTYGPSPTSVTSRIGPRARTIPNPIVRRGLKAEPRPIARNRELSPRKREGNEISHNIGAHPQGWPEGAMARGERSHYMTIVEDHGVYASTCGYCKSTKATFKSHGMSAHACSGED